MNIALNNGVTVPALGLGVFQSPPEQTTAAVEAALAADSASTTSTCSSCTSPPPTGSGRPSPRTRPWRRCSPTGAYGILTQAWSPIGGITFYPGWGEDRQNVMADPVIAAIDALDAGVRNGPDPDEAREERFAMVIPEA